MMEKRINPTLTREQARRIFDLQLRHQIYLQRVGNTYANKIWEIVDESGVEVCEYLRKRLARFGVATADRKTEFKFREIENKIAAIRMSAFNEAKDYLLESAAQIGAQEAAFAETSLAPMFARSSAMKGLSEQTLSNLSKYGTFSGKTISKWFSDLTAYDLTKIMGKVRSGVVNGRTTDQIVNEIQGTPRTNYADGLLFTSSRDASTIARTATNGMANSARMAFYEQNADVIDKVQYVATLDSRTCPVCRALDGKTWKVGDRNIPVMPLHPNSRSVLVAVAKGFGLIGSRPSKGPGGEVKQVPASTSYADWFKEQSAVFKEDMLGPTRFKLYQDGKLKLDSFVDFNGNKSFTLAELRKRDAEAFRDAKIGDIELTDAQLARMSESETFLKNAATDEKGALRRYTLKDRLNLNSTYRKRIPLTQEQEDDEKRLSTLLQKAPKFEGAVWRGLSFNTPEERARVLGVMNEAPESINEFTSTSVDASVSEYYLERYGRPYKVLIKTEDAKHGVFLGDASAQPQDREVLFDKSRHFKIIDTKEKNGIIYVRAKELEQ